MQHRKPGTASGLTFQVSQSKLYRGLFHAGQHPPCHETMLLRTCKDWFVNLALVIIYIHWSLQMSNRILNEIDEEMVMAATEEATMVV